MSEQIAHLARNAYRTRIGREYQLLLDGWGRVGGAEALEATLGKVQGTLEKEDANAVAVANAVVARSQSADNQMCVGLSHFCWLCLTGGISASFSGIQGF